MCHIFCAGQMFYILIYSLGRNVFCVENLYSFSLILKSTVAGPQCIYCYRLTVVFVTDDVCTPYFLDVLDQLVDL